MNELVKIMDNKLFVNSKQVADHFQLNGGHRYVTSVIKKLINDTGDFGVQNYLRSSYISLQNKELDCYEMTRDGFVMLAMGFTGPSAIEWKLKYLEAFNKMEQMLSGQHSVMQQLNEAIKLMEQDKEIASSCGKGLGEWKKIRKSHINAVESLQRQAQLLLNFK